MKNYIKFSFMLALIMGKACAMEHPEPSRLTMPQARRLLRISPDATLSRDLITNAHSLSSIEVIGNSPESRERRELLYAAYNLLIDIVDHRVARTIILPPLRTEHTQEIIQSNEEGIAQEVVHQDVQQQVTYYQSPSGNWRKRTIIDTKTHRRKKHARTTFNQEPNNNQRNNDDDPSAGGGTNALPSSGN